MPTTNYIVYWYTLPIVCMCYQCIAFIACNTFKWEPVIWTYVFWFRLKESCKRNANRLNALVQYLPASAIGSIICGVLYVLGDFVGSDHCNHFNIFAGESFNKHRFYFIRRDVYVYVSLVFRSVLEAFTWESFVYRMLHFRATTGERAILVADILCVYLNKIMQ